MTLSSPHRRCTACLNLTVIRVCSDSNNTQLAVAGGAASLIGSTLVVRWTQTWQCQYHQAGQQQMYRITESTGSHISSPQKILPCPLDQDYNRAKPLIILYKKTLLPSSISGSNFGMAKEHRIPLIRIRCMTWEQYQKLRKLFRGRG
jgi:hypothetical protein